MSADNYNPENMREHNRHLLRASDIGCGLLITNSRRFHSCQRNSTCEAEDKKERKSKLQNQSSNTFTEYKAEREYQVASITTKEKSSSKKKDVCRKESSSLTTRINTWKEQREKKASLKASSKIDPKDKAKAEDLSMRVMKLKRRYQDRAGKLKRKRNKNCAEAQVSRRNIAEVAISSIRLQRIMVLFNPDEQDEFWNSQHEWKIISWKLHSSSGVHTLMTNEGVVIHMLTEKKYPLKKEILVQMLNLRLESEEESTMALELIRFIKKVLADLESKEQD
ncbi:hypothetical protein Tco_0852385 [Tanacetum coccineum]